MVPKARWLRDLTRFLHLRSQFVLSGNVRDLQVHEPSPGALTAEPLARVLTDALRASGYDRIVTFDIVGGFREVPFDGRAPDDNLLGELGLSVTNGSAPGGVDLLAAALERFSSLELPQH